MSYEEFWDCDYRLVESYAKKMNLDIEEQTSKTWELTQYVRLIAHEVVSLTNSKDPKKSKGIFPEKPIPRSELGQLNAERNKMIQKEIMAVMNEKMNKRKEGSSGND